MSLAETRKDTRRLCSYHHNVLVKLRLVTDNCCLISDSSEGMDCDSNSALTFQQQMIDLNGCG
jgi:hypothetical protein